MQIRTAQPLPDLDPPSSPALLTPAFWGLLSLFILMGLLYSSQTPLFENPDESSHLQVIHYLAQQRRLPPPVIPDRRAATGADMAALIAAHSPPLYYAPPLYHALAALLTADEPLDDLTARLIPNPGWAVGWSPQSNQDPWNKNVFIHLPDETWAQSSTRRAPTGSAGSRWRWARPPSPRPMRWRAASGHAARGWPSLPPPASR